MRIHYGPNVLEAALERIRFLFDEFDNYYVCFSGGKDSTVLLQLSLMVAEEKGRLPLPVLFIDQEAEWQSVIDYMRSVMTNSRVQPWWLQVPFKIFNATSTQDGMEWLHCWEPGAHWIREKESISVHENTYGTDRFGNLYAAFLRYHHPNAPACLTSGVRTQESPGRHMGLTSAATFKGETWGKRLSKGSGPRHISMYPLYDWGFTDVWKAIYDHDWTYCSLYDRMYQHGTGARDMRVSNLHHEAAVSVLQHVQEIEPGTWDKITTRITGINTAGQLGPGFFRPKALPPMFADWREYRDYLLENLITNESYRETMRAQFRRRDDMYSDEKTLTSWYKVGVLIVMTNDVTDTRGLMFGINNRRFSKTTGSRSGLYNKEPKDA